MKNTSISTWPLLLLLFSSAACGERQSGALPTERTIAVEDTLISADDGYLAGPSDITVDQKGRVFVLDQTLSQVVVFDRSQGESRTIGRKGQGPSEFSGPQALAVSSDTLRVVDSGNGRVSVWAVNGEHVRTYPLPISGVGGATSLAEDGSLALATMGFRQEGLALVVNNAGESMRWVGELPTTGAAEWDFEAMKKDAAEGRVPAMLRNHARPALDNDQHLWIVLAEGIVQRYGPRGQLLWSKGLNMPEIAQARTTFFERNRTEKRPFAFFPLSTVHDVAVVDGKLWMLLNTGDDGSAVIAILAEDGRVRERLVLEGATGVTRFAVGPDGRELFLVSPASASVLVVMLAADQQEKVAGVL